VDVTDAKWTPPDFCPYCDSPRVATNGGEVRYDCNSTLQRRGVWCYRRAEGRWHVERQEMIEALEDAKRTIELIYPTSGYSDVPESTLARIDEVLAKARGGGAP